MQYLDREQKPERFARTLGWFSIALGTAELAAPERLARLIGIGRPNGATGVIRMMGARELAHGLAILANPREPLGVWSRVGGDGLDLWLLQQAMHRRDADQRRLLPAAAAVLGVTVADTLCAIQLSECKNRTSYTARTPSAGRASTLRIGRAATINRAIEEVYRFWRSFPNLPRVMRALESVEETGERRSHWRVRAPAGLTIEWDAEITEERENERIAWRSLSGTIDHHGAVTFRAAPGARGTELHVELEYSPPGGKIGAGMAWLLSGAFEAEIREDLRRVKQYLETGEIPLSEGPGLWRPAQPPSDPKEIQSYAGVHE